MSVSSYTNKAVNGVIGGLTNAAGSLLDGASKAVGGLFDGVSGAVGDVLGIFTSATSEKHCTITLSSCGIGDGIKNDQIDRSGINRLNTERPKAKNITDEMNKHKDDKSYKFQTYPPDLTYSNYFIQLEFGEYVRPYYGDNKQDSIRFNPSYRVDLPLPPQLSDAQSLGWQNANFGITGLAMNAMQKIGNLDLKGGNSATNWERLGENLSSIGKMAGEAALYGTGAALKNRNVLGVDLAATVGNLLGYSMNPFPGAFYVGPELRAFQFSWIFVPESREEMFLLKSIIKQIRKRTLSQPTGEIGAFLKYPEICKIKLHPDKLSSMFPIKECALAGINIDYAPYGLSFHNDKNPTAIGIGLVFAEIRPLFREDIDDTGEVYNIAGQPNTPLFNPLEAKTTGDLYKDLPGPGPF
jgi:hypothetical protein